MNVVETPTVPVFCTDIYGNDDIDNAKLQFRYENLDGDLDGYLPAEYNNLDEYVNTCNSTTDKTKLIILETHRVNNNNDNSIDNEDNVGNDGVTDDNDNYGVIYDRTDDVNPPSLPPEPNMPCIYSTNITQDGETLPIFSLVYQLEQSNEVNTLIDEVNKEYSFWRPHQDNEYTIDLIHASTKEEHYEDLIWVSNGTRQDISNIESEHYDDNYDGPSKSKHQSSTEAVPTTVPVPVICTDIVSTKTISLKLIVTAAAADLYANDQAITNPGVVLNEDANSILIAAADNNNNSNAKIKTWLWRFN